MRRNHLTISSQGVNISSRIDLRWVKILIGLAMKVIMNLTMTSLLSHLKIHHFFGRLLKGLQNETLMVMYSMLTFPL